MYFASVPFHVFLKYYSLKILYLLLYYFLYVYFGVVTSHKIIFSCISTSSLACAQRIFHKMKVVKISLHTQLEQTNLEIDFIFQKVLIILFLTFRVWNPANRICERTYILFQCYCVFIQYIWFLCYLLEWSFFITCFALLIFLVNLQYFSSLLQDLFVILNENLSQ